MISIGLMNKFVVFQVALRRARSSDNWDWTGITSAWASLRGLRRGLLSDHFFHEIPRFSVTASALKLGWRMHFLYLKMYRASSWDCRASKQPELMKTKQSRSQLRLPSWKQEPALARSTELITDVEENRITDSESFYRGSVNCIIFPICLFKYVA